MAKTLKEEKLEAFNKPQTSKDIDQNPPTSTKMLDAIVGRPTGQGYGAARKGPNIV